VVAARDDLPDDIDALKTALLAERQGGTGRGGTGGRRGPDL